jgi:hypothetical protein
MRQILEERLITRLGNLRVISNVKQDIVSWQ